MQHETFGADAPMCFLCHATILPHELLQATASCSISQLQDVLQQRSAQLLGHCALRQRCAVTAAELRMRTRLLAAGGVRAKA